MLAPPELDARVPITSLKQFSQWKNNSITNVIREKYKVGNNGIKK